MYAIQESRSSSIGLGPCCKNPIVATEINTEKNRRMGLWNLFCSGPHSLYSGAGRAAHSKTSHGPGEGEKEERVTSGGFPDGPSEQ
jgi:hypothetical protein